MPTSGDTTRNYVKQSAGQSQPEHWEIEGLNDEEIVAELLDERIELAIATAPPYDCGCDADCGRYYPGG